jgi:U6 snRNA-associated Sm-like protein LSm3
MNTIEEPLDLVKFAIGKKVLIKCRGDRELRGKIHVYYYNLGL